MKILYGLEPDFCISHPEIIVDNYQDIVLPKYFITQLEFLRHGNFTSATIAAEQIISSLIRQGDSELLIYKTSSNGTVYFIDQEINFNTLSNNCASIDIKNPLDRYLLSLVNLSSIIKAKIMFLSLTAPIRQKCLMLGFDLASKEDFTSPRESWLQPEILLEMQAKIDPLAQVKWQENLEQIVVKPENFINWLDIIN